MAARGRAPRAAVPSAEWITDNLRDWHSARAPRRGRGGAGAGGGGRGGAGGGGGGGDEPWKPPNWNNLPPRTRHRLRLDELLRRLLGVQGAPGIMAAAHFAAWIKQLPSARGQGNREIGGHELHNRWVRWIGHMLRTRGYSTTKKSTSTEGEERTRRNGTRPKDGTDHRSRKSPRGRDGEARHYRATAARQRRAQAPAESHLEVPVPAHHAHLPRETPME